MKEKLSGKIKDRVISLEKTILSALKLMDEIDKKLLLVFDNRIFINIISIGDIQRAIINNFPLDTPIKNILRKKTRLSYDTEDFKTIRQRMLKYRTECMPVLNKKNELVDVYFWEDVFSVKEKRIKRNLNLPVIIMAGGKGTRLKPLTNVIPKPLIPLDKKTIIENIMDKFADTGCNTFYISVNYKADMIRYYFETLNNSEYKISYFKENKPLGTAGSLFLLKGIINSTFFISNCDIIIDEDYGEIYDYHKNNKNELTIVAALKHYKIPYGTIESKEDGLLTELNEKPELTFKINSGMYILEPHLLNEIPDNTFFHITELIETINNRNGKIGVFPVSEKSWIDIGNREAYNLYLDRISK